MASSRSGAEVPTIQILQKSDYTKQHIVALPSSLPLPPLAPSSVRVRTSIFSLTTNNLSYARMGALLGWWDVHPLPSSTPAEFADPTTFGRISCWGYGTVIESTAEALGVGTEVFGYLPIGTLPVDLKVELVEGVRQFNEVSQVRASQLTAYNRYRYFPASSKAPTAAEKEAKGLDALLMVLMETAYAINAFTFGPAHIHPSGAQQPWTAESADIKDAVVVVFSGGGKTALSLTWLLKFVRKENRPKKVIGVTSSASQAFAQGLGLYDEVMLYGETESLKEKLGVDKDTKLVLLDFGSRDNASGKWEEILQPECKELLFMIIGGEVSVKSPAELMGMLQQRAQKGSTMTNMSALRDEALAAVGDEKYFEEFDKIWEDFKAAEGVKGLVLRWGSGMEDVGKAWDQLCNGGVAPTEGLVFEI
jgi:hypothetical protein